MLKQIVLDWSKVKVHGEGFSDYMFLNLLFIGLLFIYYKIKHVNICHHEFTQIYLNSFFFSSVF